MKVASVSLTAVLAGLSAFGADTVYKGADGGALNESANWNGASPAYDAETNAETRLYFGTAPSETYGVTLTDDLTACSAGFASGVNLNVVLKGQSLQFVSDVAFDALSSKHKDDFLPGAALTFENGTLRLLSADGATRRQFFFMNDIANGKIGRNSSVTLDAVTGEGDFYLVTTNIAVTLRNGTKWSGSFATFDGATDSRFVLTGQGTVGDFKDTPIVLTGRANYNSGRNSLVVEEGAIATNVAEITANGLDGGRIEFLSDSRVYFSSPETVDFSPDRATMRILNGQHIKVNSFAACEFGSDGLVEIGGPNTVIETTGMVQDNSHRAVRMSASATPCRNRLWIHDGAVLDGRSGNTDFACTLTGDDTTVELTDGGAFHGAQVRLGGAGSLRNTLRIDSGSQMTASRLLLGNEAYTAQTNRLWVGDGATLTLNKIQTTDNCFMNLYEDDGGQIVVSNGTLTVGGIVSYYGGYRVTLAGTAPRIECFEVRYYGPATVVFQVPEAGYTADTPLIKTTRAAAHEVNAQITPVFEMRDFARRGGGTLVISEGYNLSMSDEVMRVWRAAAEAGSDGFAKARFFFEQTENRNTRLLLEVTPRKGAVLVIR